MSVTTDSTSTVAGLGVRSWSGRQAVTIVMAWAVMVLAMMDRLAWSNVALTVSDELSLPMATLGIFVTAFFTGYVLSNLFGGFVTDRFGPRRMLTCAASALGILTISFSFMRSVSAGVTIQLAMGLLAGADYAACVKLASAWFTPKHRAKAVGIVLTALPVGVTLSNAIVPSLAKHTSWQFVYQLFGGITVVSAILCYAVLRDGPVPMVTAPVRLSTLANLLRNRNLVLLALAGFGGIWGLWGFSFLVNALMVKTQGLSPVSAGFVTMIFGLSAIVSNPLGGFISDWLGGARRPVVAVILLLFSGLLVVFGNLHSENALRFGALAVGLMAFSWGPVAATMASEVVARTNVASASGLTNGLWQTGAVIVPLVVGLIFQATHSFVIAFLLLAVGPLLGAITMLFVRELPRAARDAAGLE